ncbi:hypothetical protein SeLEV6574_g07659 [Synchytrium endobioticum]|uniref:E3 ubiquitin-protein ligase listerin n=1 Tax=Synchytrium endobioticum TaxID=286115 RepID=A0A507CGZ0_9FUNG|nr:hypothetical protein SeLEV6574_g07659 [Synchytrium endobioticum]
MRRVSDASSTNTLEICQYWSYEVTDRLWSAVVMPSQKAASSVRAQDLLWNRTSGAHGAASPRPAFGASATLASTVPAADDADHLDPQVKVLLKKLSKREAVTKVKALEDLSAYADLHEAESVQKMLFVWPKLYTKLSTDTDRKVRETANAVQLAIVKKVGKRLAPVLQDITPTWLCCLYDSSKEVVKMASQAFQTAFPSMAKRTELLAFAQRAILQYIHENILDESPETMSDPRFTSPEDMASKYARVVSSCNLVLCMLFESLPLDKVSKSQDLYNSLFDNQKFWSMAFHESPLIRKSVYTLVKTLVKSAPAILESRLPLVTTLYLSQAFTDSDTSTHSEMWDSVLMYTRAFPSSWNEASLQKPIVSGVFTYLDNAAYGSVNASYPSLLPLLSILPPEVLQPEAFAKQFLSHFWNGAKNGVVDKSNGLVFFSSFLECILYLLMRHSNNPALQQYLIDVEFFKCIEAFLEPFKHSGIQSKYPVSEMSHSITDSLSRLSSSSQIPNAISRLLISKIFSRACEIFTSETSLTDLDIFATRFSQLLNDLNSRLTSSPDSNLHDLTATSARDLCAKLISTLVPNAGLAPRASLLATLCKFPIWNDGTIMSGLRQLLTSPNFGAVLAFSVSAATSLYDVLIGYLNQPTSDPLVWQHVVSLIAGNERSRALLLIEELSRKTANLEMMASPSVMENFVKDLLHFDALSAFDREIAQRLLWSIINKDTRWLTPLARRKLVLSIMEDIVDFASAVVKAQSPRISTTSVTYMMRIMTPISTITHLQNQYQGQFLSSVLDLVSFSPEIDPVRAAGEAAVYCWNGLTPLLRTASVGVFVFEEMANLWQKDVLDADHVGSADQFVAKASNLLDIVPLSLKSHVADCLIPNESKWLELSAPFQHPSPSLAVMDSSTVLEIPASPSVANIDGLATLLRLGLVVAGVVHTTSTQDFFHNPYRSGILVELLYLAIVIDDFHAAPPALSNRRFVGDDDVAPRVFITESRRILEEVLRPCRDIQDTCDWHLRIVDNASTEVSKAEWKPKDMTESLIATAFSLSNTKGGGYARVLGTIMAKVFGMTQLQSVVGRRWFELAQRCYNKDRIASSVALLSALWVHLEVFPELQDFIHTVASEVVESSDEVLAHQLAVLTSCLRIEIDGLGKLLPAVPAMNVIRRLRKYHHSSSGHGTIATDVLMLDTVRIFVDLQIEFDVNSAGFVVELCCSHSSSSSMLRQYYVLELLQSLLNAFKQDPGTWGAITKQEVALYRWCLQLLFKQGGCLRPTKAEMKLQHLLATLASTVPDEILSENQPFDELCALLFVHNEEIQTCAALLLRKLTNEHVQSTSLKLEMAPREPGEDAPSTAVEAAEERLPRGLMNALGQAPSELEYGSAPEFNTASYEGFGYILSWMIYFDHLDDATLALTTAYVGQLKQQADIWAAFMEFLFSALGLGVQSKPFDLSKWDVQSMDISEFDFRSEVAFPLAAGHLYWRALRATPSLVRSWWSESKKRQLTLAVETYTQTYFSPLLISREIATVARADKSQFDNMHIKASTKTSEISATYTVEDSGLEMIIRLPSSFPLKQVEVDSGPGGRAGVTDAKWRSWLLSASAVMFAQNGSVLDAVSVFKKTISAHFEGIEDCAICYSLIGPLDRTLPSKKCKTCKHVFHASCLFKWFKTSTQSTCPLCRSLF